MYEQHNGKAIAEKLIPQIKREIEFENEIKKELKEFNIIEYLYGK